MSPPVESSADIFYWKGITLLQDQSTLKVGTDAILLGTWVTKVIAQADHILDIGTGCGILSLMMAQYFSSAQIMAIDSSSAAVSLAARNFQQADWCERMEVQLHEFSEYHPGKKFDLIVSNPPFFHGHILPSNEIMQHAKHSALTIADWMKRMALCLRADGFICVVVPYPQARTWIAEANRHGLFGINRLDVFSFAEDESPKRSMICFDPLLRKPSLENITMYNSNKVYSDEYRAWLGL